MGYLERIRENILEKGNSYGEDMDIVDDGEIHEVILHRGCTTHFREEHISNAVINLLNKKGIDFTVLSDETCCGLMLYYLGDDETGDKVAKANIEKFNRHGVKKIITLCPGCYETFTKQYTRLPGFDIGVVFAMDLVSDEEIDGTGYVVMDPCHALDKKDLARSIIKNVPEKRANSCCGFGAGVRAGSSELTKKMATRTVSGDRVITYCPACYHTLSKIDEDKCVDFYELMDEHLS